LLVVALEASADVHGAAVLRALRALRPDVQAFGAGGPHLRAEGLEALVYAEDVSMMGIAEVLPALPRVLDAMDLLRDAARDRRPSAALLIDSPDFNLRLARRLRELRVPVAYFIGPSVWAWRTGRVRQIARDVERMLVILPFEKEFYARHGVSARYVGNPTAELLSKRAIGSEGSHSDPRAARAAARAEIFGPAAGHDAPVLALFPGSRRQEIRHLWQPILAAARLLQKDTPDLRLVVPIAPTLSRENFGHAPGVHFVQNARAALAAADAAIVKSGTSTLEAALLGTPMVCVYRTSWLSYLVGRMLIRVRHVSLPNLLAGRAMIPELLQSDCTPERIAAAIQPLLREGSEERNAQLDGMQRLRVELAPEGAASAALTAAREVAALL
jgi:lipid-A-disaccharide synthase